MDLGEYFAVCSDKNNEVNKQNFNISRKETTPKTDADNITSQRSDADEISTGNNVGSNIMGQQDQCCTQFSLNLLDTVKREVAVDEERKDSVAAGNVSFFEAISNQEKITVHAEFGQQTLYQTMTIVPSEDVNGEISYILIVNQQGYETQMSKESNVTQAGESAPDVTGTDGEDDKSAIRKLPVKGLPFMCSYCSYTSTAKYKVTRHMKSHSSERPHSCSVCERSFKTPTALKNHINMHNGIKPHHCSHCERAFTTSGELVRHVRYMHTHEKPHKCEECDYSSVERSKLKRHARCHTGERPYQCKHCTYASPDTFKLKRHLRTHTQEKPYECDNCKMRFSQSNSLKAHKMIHNNNKPIYPCTLCPSTCGRKTDLRTHIKTQHMPELKRCNKCGKTFLDRYSYRMHNKTHIGEKCYRCDLCPYESISQRHLKSHILIHMNQKPFACEECELTFRQKQLLKRHHNLYHNPHYVLPTPLEKHHECQECGTQFRYEGNLVRHSTVVHAPGSARQEKSTTKRSRGVNAGSTVEGVNLVKGNFNNNVDQYVILEVR